MLTPAGFPCDHSAVVCHDAEGGVTGTCEVCGATFQGGTDSQVQERFEMDYADTISADGLIEMDWERTDDTPAGHRRYIHFMPRIA